ncbi:MAG: ROK family protein, partial [Halieaceae bacterium]|nr:ROK family protein [Halieaceae bacterium]
IKQQGPIQAIGIGSFGPIGINPNDTDYGVIGTTPKPHWTGIDLLSAFSKFNAPLIIESDVNAAALAEAKSLLPNDKGRLIYITVGTGIGAGVVDNGNISNGVHHPEMGHIRLPRHPDDDYIGHCPIHGACLEGLACGPAIIDRWGKDLSTLGVQHESHDIIAHYLGSFAANLLLTYAPNYIVLGGGVSLTDGLLNRARQHAFEQLGGYLGRFEHVDQLGSVIQAPSLDTLSGIAGAYLLAEQALKPISA